MGGFQKLGHIYMASIRECLNVPSLSLICQQICTNEFCSLWNWMHLTVHYVTCENGTILKFGHRALKIWFYPWEQFYINRLNMLGVVTNWSWKYRKATRPLGLFVKPVTILGIKGYHCCENNSRIIGWLQT